MNRRLRLLIGLAITVLLAVGIRFIYFPSLLLRKMFRFKSTKKQQIMAMRFQVRKIAGLG